MKLAKILAITVALAFSGFGAWAQTAPATANPNTSQNAPKTYRLTYTLTETDGTKRIGTQHFAMIVVTGRKTVLKQGSKVPIATGAYNADTPRMDTQFQYVDVGVHIEASLEESVDGVKLDTRVDYSSLAEEKSGVGAQNPIIRETSVEGTSILTPGKPLMLGSMDIQGGTRHLDVDVVTEPVVQ